MSEGLVTSIVSWLDALSSPAADQGWWVGSDDADLESVRNELAAAARKVAEYAKGGGGGGGRPITPEEAPGVPEDRRKLCSAMLQKCFERLKKAAGDWDGVDVRWRGMYADVCTVQAVWSCRRTLLDKPSAAGTEPEEIRAALRLVDLGFIADRGDKSGLGRPPSLRSRIARKLHEEALALVAREAGDPDDMKWCPSPFRKRARSFDDTSPGMSLDSGTIKCGQCSLDGRKSCVASWTGQSLVEHAAGLGTCLPLLTTDADLDVQVAKKEPCLVQGLAEKWPACKKWRDLWYMRSVAGLRVVPVEVGGRYNEPGSVTRMMRLNDFLDQYVIGVAQDEAIMFDRLGSACSVTEFVPDPLEVGAGGDGGKCPTAYMAQHALFEQIPELGEDVEVPGVCGRTGKGRLRKVNAWVGPAGTVSPLHTDRFDNILQQVVGDKYVRIYAPEHGKALRPGVGALSNTSNLDIRGDAATFGPDGAASDASSLPFTEGILREGTALFIPAGHWHYVRSLTPSVSVNFWWQ